jgi:hypothetical protein
MLRLMPCALGVALLAGTALAQTAPHGTQRDMSTSRTGGEPGASRADSEARSPGPPIDRGPRTPEANRAFMGGGVVLEGVPGGPTPIPQALPPTDPTTRMR